MSDALKNANAKPEAWLAKDFFKAERIKSLTRAARERVEDCAQGRIRQWKFADGSGELDPSKAVAAVNALTALTFTDVAST